MFAFNFFFISWVVEDSDIHAYIHTYISMNIYMCVRHKAIDTHEYPKMAVITLCEMHGYTVSYNNSDGPFIIMYCS